MALRLVPDDPKTLVVLGYWCAANGDLGSAEATLKRAATIAPRNPGVLAAIANFYFAIEEAKSPRTRDYASMEGWVESLEHLANAPGQWNFIAWYWAQRGEPARGIEFARRAVREDPACAECYDTLALLLDQQGAVFDAVQAQRVAVNLSESEGPDMLRRLERFERDLLALNRQVAPPPKSVVDGIAALGADCQKAVPLSTAAPEYPSVARKNDVRGQVRARFVVREDGSVTDVVATSGPALLAEAAVSAIRTWRFSPARCAGREVVSSEEARIPFSLRNR
jgi:protein TonB